MRSGAIKAVGLTVGLGLLGWVIWDAVAQSQSVEWPALPMMHILAATLLVIVAHGLHGLAWAIGAQTMAGELGLLRGIAIYSVAFIGRYLPGKIWQIGAASYLAKNRGADPYQIAGYSLMFLIIFQGLGALILLLAFGLSGVAFGWLMCFVGALAISLLSAGLYHAGSEKLLAILSEGWRVRLQGGLHQPFQPLVLNIMLLATCWLIFGTSGFVLAQGFSPEWSGDWTHATMATLGGLIAGFLVLIAPSGAGVRESAISVSLTAMGVSPIASIALAIALRLAMTVSELLWAAFGALFLFGPTLKQNH